MGRMWQLTDTPVCVRCGKAVDVKRDEWEVWLGGLFCGMPCKLAHMRLMGLERGGPQRLASREQRTEIPQW